MPPGRGAALREQKSAARDIRKEGARVTVRFNGRPINPDTGAPTGSAAATVVKTYGVLDGFKSDEVGAGGVQQGDLRLWVAEFDLGALRSTVNSLGPGMRLGPGGFDVFLAANPEVHAEVTDQTARRMRVISLLETVHVGGYPVLHSLQVRGAVPGGGQ